MKKIEYNSLVTYYMFEGCHEDAKSCTATTTESSEVFPYSEWGQYIDISRDPRDERQDSRDFLQQLSSVMGDYSSGVIID